MKKVSLILCSVGLLFSGSVLAQEATKLPQIDTDFGGVMGMLVSAFQGGDWFLAGGIVIMILVWSAGRFLPIKTKWLPLLALGAGMIAGVLTSYINGVEWQGALYKGLLTSGQATMFWTLLGKKVLPVKKETE